MNSKNTLYDLLKVSFDAGVNAGIIEAAHQLNLLKDEQLRDFYEFMDKEEVRSLFETLCNNFKDED